MRETLSDLVDLGRPPIRVFSTRSGLPQSTIQALAFDRRGYLWAGTQDGAARYNGRAWLAVPMPNRTVSNFVGAVCPSADGSMWFGTNGGGVLRLSRDRWTAFDSANSGLPSDQVRCLLETVNRAGEPVLWVGTRSGLACYVRGAWTVFGTDAGIPHEVVRTVLHTVEPDGERALWVGTRAGLAKLVKNEVVDVYDTSSGLPDMVVTSLLKTEGGDRSTVMWVGTEGGGLARFDRGEWTRMSQLDGLGGDSVNGLAMTTAVDGVRSLWAATDGGLSRLRSGTWRTIATEEGLPSNAVMSVLPADLSSPTPALWAGTIGGGVARVELGRWTSIARREGLPTRSVWAVLDRHDRDGRDELWIGTLGGGLARFDGSWKIFDKGSGLPDNTVVSLAATTDGALLAGTLGGGFARWDGSEWSVPRQPRQIAENAVLGILEASDGSLWLATNGGGLGRYHAGSWTVFDTSNGLTNNVVVCLHETNDLGGATVWAGTNGGGLCAYRDGHWSVVDASSGLPNNLVMGIGETRDERGSRTLWVGTAGGGAARLELDAKKPTWSCLSTANEPWPSSDVVYQIKQDALGRIYVFTNRGIDRLTPVDGGYEVYTYSMDDGLPASECNAGASHVDAQGRIWAGTSEGVAVLNPTQEIVERDPSLVTIERARIEGREHDLEPGESLSYDKNDVEFEFAMLRFFREESTRFRTQLVGYDLHPSPWSAEWARRYTNLPEGRYTFRVWGRDAAGIESGPAELAFAIRSAPWRTWWAYAAYAGAASGAGYAGIRMRVDALRRRNEELEQAIAERTVELADTIDELRISERRALDANRAKSVFLSSMSHELRTPLNAILGFVQVMRRAPARSRDDIDYLDIVSRSGEHLLGLINDVLSISKIEAGKQQLNSQTFDLHMLLQGIGEMVSLKADTKAIKVEIDRDASVPRLVVGDEGKLRQVLINLLGNAVKFTARGGVRLKVNYAGGIARFSVTDTGHGISASEVKLLFQPFQQTESGYQTGEGTGLGLAISQSFVGLMGGEIRVTSRLGKGSTFSFEIPIPAADAQEALPDSRIVVGVEAGQPSYKMLVVDDTPANRLLLRKLLEPLGFQMREASNGREAVAAWDSWRPDMIWLDMRLPVMSGVEATREIRSREVDRCKIIALTASAFDHDRIELEEAGCDGFVAKPYHEHQIFDAIAEHLGVRFVYKGAEEEQVQSFGELTEGLGPRLEKLETDLRDALREASMHGDLEAAAAAIDGILPVDEELAEDLRTLVRGYRFDEILDAL